MDTARKARLKELAEALGEGYGPHPAPWVKGTMIAVRRAGLCIFLTEEQKAVRLKQPRGQGGVPQTPAL